MDDAELKARWDAGIPARALSSQALRILARHKSCGLMGYLRRRVALDLGFKGVLLPIFLALAWSGHGEVKVAAWFAALLDVGLGWLLWREGWIPASIDGEVLPFAQALYLRLERFKARALPPLAFTGTLMSLAFFLDYFQGGFHPKALHWPVMVLCLFLPPWATWRLLLLRIRATQAYLKNMDPEAWRMEREARGLWILALLLVLMLLGLGLALAV